MEISTIQYKHCDVVQPQGRIDSATAPQLEAALNALTQAGRFKIILDMTHINFVSSAGWWVLIGAQKTCKKLNRGEVAIACIASGIRESLKLVGMDEYFRIYDDMTSAVGNI
jgi:anti-sigma B factor antagonist